MHCVLCLQRLQLLPPLLSSPPNSAYCGLLPSISHLLSQIGPLPASLWVVPHSSSYITFRMSIECIWGQKWRHRKIGRIPPPPLPFGTVCHYFWYPPSSPPPPGDVIFECPPFLFVCVSVYVLCQLTLFF